MNNSAKARIAYAGPALDNGEMDVRELAPALLAFADLVEAANIAIGGERKIRVMLNEDSIRKGSFDITMLLDYSLIDQAKLFVSAADANGLSSLMTILGWGETAYVAEKGICVIKNGIFSLIKKIANRKVTGIEHSGKEEVTLTLSDGTKITVTDGILKVFLDVRSREDIEKIVNPVGNEGIDRFELRNPERPNDQNPIEKIEKSDVPNFAAPPADETEETFPKTPEQELTVKITLLNFARGQKWKLTDGNNTFWARIEDEEFLDKVEKGQNFANGDMLRIRYYTQQSIKNGNLSSDYVVTKVLEIRRRPEQIKLGFDYREK